MDDATKQAIDEAVARARVEVAAEYQKTKSSLEAWVTAHPVIAFRVGTIGGVIAGGFAVYETLRFLG